tara:strand:- start:25 stop:231 length:207 start_codon:yes stop_codon:yes gene_type:complete
MNQMNDQTLLSYHSFFNEEHKKMMNLFKNDKNGEDVYIQKELNMLNKICMEILKLRNLRNKMLSKINN